MPSYFGYVTYENQEYLQFPFNDYPSYDLSWPWLSYDTYLNIQNTINSYANLLIIQYIEKPKAYATIQTLVTPSVMGLVPSEVENGFQLGTAVGPQLDVLGLYTGATRTGYGPNGVITLDDADFTTFIQLAIVDNSINSSLYSIQQFLHTYFLNTIFVFDYMTMRLSYFINSDGISLNLAILFVNEGRLPKPLGVQLSSVIYAPLDILTSFFSCRTYEAAAPAGTSPLNDYSDYMTDYPWLTYQDRLIV